MAVVILHCRQLHLQRKREGSDQWKKHCGTYSKCPGPLLYSSKYLMSKGAAFAAQAKLNYTDFRFYRLQILLTPVNGLHRRAKHEVLGKHYATCWMNAIQKERKIYNKWSEWIMATR